MRRTAVTKALLLSGFGHRQVLVAQNLAQRLIEPARPLNFYQMEMNSLLNFSLHTRFPMLWSWIIF